MARVNRVIDHVEGHLVEDLDLTLLAEIAGFSPFHFHRIFASVMGETPHGFIQRVRLERAAAELVAHPRTPITRIALGCGFSGSAPFARAFRSSFGMSASAWRAGGHLQWRATGDGRADAAARKCGDGRYRVVAEELDGTTGLPVWWLQVLDWDTAPVALRRLPSFNLAYVRYVGRYQGDSALFGRLFEEVGRWAGPRGLLADGNGWWVCLYHDDPEVTDDDRLRVTVGLTVPPATRTSGSIGSTVVAGGLYAVGRFALGENDYPHAWAAMMAGWLPESGCQLDDRHCFERFPVLAHGTDGCGTGGTGENGATVTQICLPVRPR